MTSWLGASLDILFDRRLEAEADGAGGASCPPCVTFLLRLDRRLDDVDCGFSVGMVGPSGASGLDMLGGALPFRRRDAAAGGGACTGGGGCGGGWKAGCVTRCRLERRAEVGGSEAASAGSTSGWDFRFLREGGAGVCTAGGGATTAAGVEFEDAAWLAA
jgi:hypothetical protein